MLVWAGFACILRYFPYLPHDSRARWLEAARSVISVPNRADLPRSLSTGPESPPSPSKTGSILGDGGWSPNLSKFSGAKRPTIFLCESSTAAAESVNARVRAAMQGSLVTACPGTFRVGSRQYIMKDGYRRLTTYGLFSPARCCCSVVWAWRLPCFVILRHFW